MQPTPVLVDPSQFPEAVREGLHRCLQLKRIESKFHYDSYRQTQAWLALHEAISPARLDPACRAIYESAMSYAATQPGQLHVIGLGCGGGQKDHLLLSKLHRENRPARYTPVDVSVAMTLVATEHVRPVAASCSPTVCDLAHCQDLAALIGSDIPAIRVITFFGMLPNLDASLILPKIATLMRPGDWLFVSANLGPADGYPDSLHAILPQYNNQLTHDWLMILLRDLGFESEDGVLRWTVERASANSPLHGFVAWFEVEKARTVRLDDRTYLFKPGERIQLFASWRYTTALLAAELAKAGLRLGQQWCTAEEGVFLVTV